MDTYELYDIIPKFEATDYVHSTIQSRLCRILRLKLGRRGWLLDEIK